MSDETLTLSHSLREGARAQREHDRIVAEVRAADELRSSLENPQTPLSYPDEWLLDAWNGGRTDSGIRVSELTALQFTTCYACVNLISTAIASLDLNIYEHTENATGRSGKRLAVDHQLFDLLHDEPNPEMTSFTFFRTLMVHALLWSNGYAEIQRDNANRAVGLWPLMPGKTRPYRNKSGDLVYRTSVGVNQTPMEGKDPAAVNERQILAADMFHVPGLSLDGRVGYGVIQLVRQSFGIALAAEKFGARFFANNAKPSGIIEVPGKLKPEARTTLRDTWQQSQTGDNVQKTAVLEEGMKYNPIGIKPNEGQVLETRQFQKGETCAVFQVAPHMIGDSEKSNRANTEQLGLEFVSFTLRHWLKNIQSESKRKLFPKTGRTSGKFFPRFDTTPFTMPDATTRQTYFNSGKQWGWLNTNDIHEMEHLNPSEQDGAELYWMPVNMGIMGAEGAIIPKPATPPADPNAPKPAAGADPEDDETVKRFVRSHSGLFRDALGRLSARSEPDTDAFIRAFEPILTSMATQISTLAGEAADDGFDFTFDSKEYIRGMRKRLDEARPSNIGLSREQIADRETARAVRAITIEAYRALATAKAKKQLEEKT